MNVLMVGATGEFAGLVLPELKKRDIEVYALIHDRNQSPEVKRKGADYVILGDLNDPASLRAATEGMDGVFHINPGFAENEAKMGLQMVRAAEMNDVEKFVFSAVYHPSLPLVNHAGKRPVEEALYKSNMKFVILQPAMFMQMIGMRWSQIKKNGVITQPYSPRSKVSYVDYRDVAEAAGKAFVDDALDYGTFELSAPGMVTHVHVAQILSHLADMEIKARKISFNDFADQANITDPFRRQGMETMFDSYDRYGFHGGNSLVLESVLGRQPHTLRQYLREMVENHDG